MFNNISTWFLDQNPVIQALLAGMMAFTSTSLGACTIIFLKKVNQKIIDGLLGFSAGIMLAASFWSLLAPAIDLATPTGFWKVALGFLCGGFFIWSIDKILPHVHLFAAKSEGPKTKWRRSTLLVIAITIHNIPEGLAIGVAFGALAFNPDPAILAGALGIAIGISIQDFPEGIAISAPMYGDGISKKKAILFGALSGVFEPIAAVIGAILVIQVQSILPFALAFAGGAMIYVVIEELIPESQAHNNVDFATLSAMIGFVIMVSLDVLL